MENVNEWQNRTFLWSGVFYIIKNLVEEFFYLKWHSLWVQILIVVSVFKLYPWLKLLLIVSTEILKCV